MIYLDDLEDLFRSIMETLLRWDAEGLLPLAPITAFPFDDVVSAHKAIESEKAFGVTS